MLFRIHFGYFYNAVRKKRKIVSFFFWVVVKQDISDSPGQGKLFLSKGKGYADFSLSNNNGESL